MKHKANLDEKYLHAVLCCKISVNNLFLSDIIHSFADLNSKLNKLARGNCLGKKINSKFLFKDLTYSTFLYLCNLHWSNDQEVHQFLANNPNHFLKETVSTLPIDAVLVFSPVLLQMLLLKSSKSVLGLHFVLGELRCKVALNVEAPHPPVPQHLDA